MSVSAPRFLNWNWIDKTPEEVLNNYFKSSTEDIVMKIGYGALLHYTKRNLRKSLDLCDKLVRILPPENLILFKKIFLQTEKIHLFPGLVNRAITNKDENHLLRLLNFIDEISSDQFILCCKFGYAHAIKKIIEKGISPNQMNNEKQYYALHLVSSLKNMDLIRELLDLGAEVDVLTEKKRTPLHIAAEKGDQEIAELLLDRHANVNKQDIFQFTPIHYACAYQHIALTIKLVERGADLSITQRDGDTAVTLALKSTNEAWRGVLSHLFKEFYFISNTINEKPFTDILSTIIANPDQFIHPHQNDIGANPLEVPLLLNDPTMMSYMKGRLSAEKFACLSQKLQEKYPLTANRIL